MATFVFSDASLVIDSVDLSDHGIQLAVDIGAELLDNTVFGHTARTQIPGLLTGGASLTFLQDYASAKVDATLFALLGPTGGAVSSDGTFVFVWRPTSAAKGPSNPQYTATMCLATYNPTGDSVGDQAKATATFANAGTGGWARDATS